MKSTDEGVVEDGARAEVVQLLHVEEDGRVRPSLHVAVYFDARPGQRALYTGTHDHLGFDHWEARNEPGEATYVTREWQGLRTFHRSKVGDRARRLVDFERKRVEQLIKDGHWLSEAVAVAKREARRARDWADAHVRALAAMPPESFGRSMPLYACVGSVESAVSDLVAQQYRLRLLSNALVMLRDTHPLGEDD